MKVGEMVEFSHPKHGGRCFKGMLEGSRKIPGPFMLEPVTDEEKKIDYSIWLLDPATGEWRPNCGVAFHDETLDGQPNLSINLEDWEEGIKLPTLKGWVQTASKERPKFEGKSGDTFDKRVPLKEGRRWNITRRTVKPKGQAKPQPADRADPLSGDNIPF